MPGNPTLVDWSGILTTPVKDQGYCGSCWAFSAVEQIESDTIRQTGNTFVLSPEQVADCTYKMGCMGGATEMAYKYVMDIGGVQTNEDYPYTASTYAGKSGECVDQTNGYKPVVSISKFYEIVGGEPAMSSYMYATGPLSVCVDATKWNTYKSGVMKQCSALEINHCVQAVGVDATSGGYWKVRNSWGAAWGESGYIRLSYGSNTCGIETDPTYTDVVMV